jgi:hypothetical protein
MKKISSNEIYSCLKDNVISPIGLWVPIYVALAPELEYAILDRGEYARCPLHPDRDCFIVHEDVDQYGGCSCRQYGDFNGYTLLMLLQDRLHDDIASDVDFFLQRYEVYAGPAIQSQTFLTKTA